MEGRVIFSLIVDNIDFQLEETKTRCRPPDQTVSHVGSLLEFNSSTARRIFFIFCFQNASLPQVALSKRPCLLSIQPLVLGPVYPKNT